MMNFKTLVFLFVSVLSSTRSMEDFPHKNHSKEHSRYARNIVEILPSIRINEPSIQFLKKYAIKSKDDLENALTTMCRLDVKNWYDAATAFRHTSKGKDFAELIFQNIIKNMHSKDAIISLAYTGLAKIKASQGLFEASYQLCYDALHYNPTNGFLRLWLGNLPNVEHDEQIHHFLVAKVISKRTHNNLLRVLVYISLGNAGYQYPYQAVWFFKALDILGSQGDVNLLARAYLGLGNLKFDYPHDDVWYHKALKVLRDRGDSHLIRRARMGIQDCERGNQKRKFEGRREDKKQPYSKKQKRR